MKDTEFDYQYDCDWDRVTLSFWKKYWHPKCKQSRAMVLSRHINSEGCLVTKRLHVIYQDVPAFIAALGGNIVTYAGEESVVDPKNKTMTLRTKNLSLTSVASVDEFCTYCQSKEDPSKTAYSKRLEINGFLPGFLNSQIEGYFVYADTGSCCVRRPGGVTFR